MSTQEATVGATISLQSVNYPDRYVRHRNFLGELTEVSSDLDQRDATFVIRPGLAGGSSISFESVNFPGRVLRHQGYRVKLDEPDGSNLFKNDASFQVHPGLAGSGTSFESINFPGFFLRHCSFNMWIDNNARENSECDSDTEVFHADVSFDVVPGLKQAKGVSLHIGLNSLNPDHYGGWVGTLASCEFDAQDMHGIADAVGYSSTLLETAAATRDAVIGGIQAAASSLDSGDIFFVSYAGHGGQVPDKNGDEADNQDETWCLFDGQLIDDELAVLWSSFKPGTRILVLSDSCHSGTVTRAALAGTAIATNDAVRSRNMPTEAAARTYRTNKVFYDEIQRALPSPLPEVTATVQLVSGCQDNQLSGDGAFNGAFTGQLLQVWNDGKFVGDYSKFTRAIRDRLPANQSPNDFVYGAANPTFAAEKPFTI